MDVTSNMYSLNMRVYHCSRDQARGQIYTPNARTNKLERPVDSFSTFFFFLFFFPSFLLSFFLSFYRPKYDERLAPGSVARGETRLVRSVTETFRRDENMSFRRA